MDEEDSVNFVVDNQQSVIVSKAFISELVIEYLKSDTIIPHVILEIIASYSIYHPVVLLEYHSTLDHITLNNANPICLPTLIYKSLPFGTCMVNAECFWQSSTQRLCAITFKHILSRKYNDIIMQYTDLYVPPQSSTSPKSTGIDFEQSSNSLWKKISGLPQDRDTLYQRMYLIGNRIFYIGFDRLFLNSLSETEVCNVIVYDEKTQQWIEDKDTKSIGTYSKGLQPGEFMKRIFVVGSLLYIITTKDICHSFDIRTSKWMYNKHEKYQIFDCFPGTCSSLFPLPNNGFLTYIYPSYDIASNSGIDIHYIVTRYIHVNPEKKDCKSRWIMAVWELPPYLLSFNSKWKHAWIEPFNERLYILFTTIDNSEIVILSRSLSLTKPPKLSRLSYSFYKLKSILGFGTNIHNDCITHSEDYFTSRSTLAWTLIASTEIKHNPPTLLPKMNIAAVVSTAPPVNHQHPTCFD